MTRILALALGLAAAVLAPSPALAQSRDRWQVTLDGDQYLWDIKLVRLDGDKLVVSQADSTIEAPVARITEIRRIAKSEVQLGPGAAGGAFNALVGGDDEIYDLSTLELADRLRAVQKLLLYNPPDSGQ